MRESWQPSLSLARLHLRRTRLVWMWRETAQEKREEGGSIAGSQRASAGGRPAIRPPPRSQGLWLHLQESGGTPPNCPAYADRVGVGTDHGERGAGSRSQRTGSRREGVGEVGIPITQKGRPARFRTGIWIWGRKDIKPFLQPMLVQCKPHLRTKAVSGSRTEPAPRMPSTMNKRMNKSTLSNNRDDM